MKTILLAFGLALAAPSVAQADVIHCDNEKRFEHLGLGGYKSFTASASEFSYCNKDNKCATKQKPLSEKDIIDGIKEETYHLTDPSDPIQMAVVGFNSATGNVVYLQVLLYGQDPLYAVPLTGCTRK